VDGYGGHGQERVAWAHIGIRHELTKPGRTVGWAGDVMAAAGRPRRARKSIGQIRSSGWYGEYRMARWWFTLTAYLWLARYRHSGSAWALMYITLAEHHRGKAFISVRQIALERRRLIKSDGAGRRWLYPHRALRKKRQLRAHAVSRQYRLVVYDAWAGSLSSSLAAVSAVGVRGSRQRRAVGLDRHELWAAAKMLQA